MAY
ncbi:hypothetical protein ECPA24_2192, partial [Escherichia coli PA24]|jgi:U3 small nucleolar RNA-associated protein 25